MLAVDVYTFVFDPSSRALLFLAHGRLERFDGRRLRTLLRLNAVGLSTPLTIQPCRWVHCSARPAAARVVRRDGAVISSTALPHLKLRSDRVSSDAAADRGVHKLGRLWVRLRRRPRFEVGSSNPDGAWMLQQARNLLMEIDDRDQRLRFLIHDRDTKFSRAFDAIFHGEAMRVIRTPVRAPNANAHIERWVGSVRRECLDRLLIFNRRQLQRVLRVYVGHYNQRRPHRALDLQAPDPSTMPSTRGQPAGSATAIRRQDLLGGLIHEYEPVAA